MDVRHPLKRLTTIVVVLLGGMGMVSPSLANIITIYGGQFNLPIPDKPGMLDAIIEITDHQTIHDLDVRINISHGNVFDLQIILQGPDGTAISLNSYNLEQFFEGANYIETVFDDEALLPIEQAQAPFTGRFRPIEPYRLSQFYNTSVYGLWHLRIYDMYYYNTGTLNSFELIVTAPEPPMLFLLTLGAVMVRKKR